MQRIPRELGNLGLCSVVLEIKDSHNTFLIVTVFYSNNRVIPRDRKVATIRRQRNSSVQISESWQKILLHWRSISVREFRLVLNHLHRFRDQKYNWYRNPIPTQVLVVNRNKKIEKEDQHQGKNTGQHAAIRDGGYHHGMGSNPMGTNSCSESRRWHMRRWYSVGSAS